MSPRFWLSRGGKNNREDALSLDLSEISDTEIVYSQPEPIKSKGKQLNLHKHKKRKENNVISLEKIKDHKKRSHRVKKKTHVTVISESSEESEDEYRNKRRKLANAVALTNAKNDTSSLKARLRSMLCGNQISDPMKTDTAEIKSDCIIDSLNWGVDTLEDSNINQLNNEKQSESPNEDLDLEAEIYRLIDLCENDNVHKTVISVQSEDCVDSVANKKGEESVEARVDDSDEDLELLRQHALKTKSSKIKVVQEISQIKPNANSEDEDSDTAELRAICLKSALLKKAIEMKRKQKLRKRLSQSFHDEFVFENNNVVNENEEDNNTDIESVDMDIGSDADEKSKETNLIISDISESVGRDIIKVDSTAAKAIPSSDNFKEDEIDEDEDLLRAKLLTSLSKNLPNLVGSHVTSNNNSEGQISSKNDVKTIKPSIAPEHKPLIINLGESDSEGEHEATKNLTKMHMKLSEQVDFQQKLDLFLKSTRMEVEKKSLPDIIGTPLEQIKPTPKYVAKAVKHLPKPEQIEYKNLVKRMAELEKIKQARQLSMNQFKETLKPRNNTIELANSSDINLEEQIAISRKKIAEESAKLLRVKEEATKLSQKHKIAATELRNITTAITLNKKEQRLINNKLSKIRHQHQLLLKRSPSLKHSNANLPVINRVNGKQFATAKLQKENNPVKEDYKNPLVLKSVKVSVVNDLKEDSLPNSRLSVEVDVSNNKKSIKITKNVAKERIVDVSSQNGDETCRETSSIPLATENGNSLGHHNEIVNTNNQAVENKDKVIDDYKSPLESLQRDTWVEDPNTFLCPFEVGGTCKDPDCKNLHPKVPSNR